jgi:threonine dehydratase
MSLTGIAPAITYADVETARARIAGKVRRTPVMTSDELDQAAGARLFFKCENLQEIGAFKARGATNAVFALSDAAAAKGVATHSSGNHGAAVARAAALRGVPAYIVMPGNVAKPKAEQVRRLGGRITLSASTLAAREATVEKVLAKTGATLIHPYDDVRVMAGQGTAALELMEDAPALDVVLAPIGGGGLISGVSTAVKAVSPKTRVVGVEPAAADDAARSFRTGRIVPADNPKTIADGLRAQLSERTFGTICAHVDDIVTVSEAAIVEAMRAVWGSLRVIIEPSAAVPLAAIREARLDVKGRSVGIILTGGNVDLDKLPWV